MKAEIRDKEPENNRTMMQSVPAIIYQDFVAGMWPLSQQLVHAIGMQTAIYFLEVFSDMASQGMREFNVTVSTGVQTHKVFARTDGALAFQPRISRYEKGIDQTLLDWQGAYFSSEDFSVV